VNTPIMHLVATPKVFAVDLNAPGSYVHWNVFTIAAANLGLILAMLLIFLVALFVPFPGSRQGAEVPPAGDPQGSGPEEPNISLGGPKVEAPSWTGRVRALGLRIFPPERLLPEYQPSYVGSWIYVFGVATLAALALAIISGVLIALGGVDWWHTNPAGHFFNSLHLWSVELFMAFMVIHLWGKFFMAAWRGKRARTWITGVLAFLVSIVEAFTGYLSQSNFDSQWIATNGKDAFNAAGVGGFFNLMNQGQMLLWHVVLVPLVLVAIVGIHILLVRYRGVVHPFPARSGRDALGQRIAPTVPLLSRQQSKKADASEWRGPRRRYDLIREAALATVVALVATAVLAAVLSSPDVGPITIKQWATAAPGDFVGTAAAELAGTSETATYGPPYNNQSSYVQRIGVSWQTLAGVLIPIDAAHTFVLDPLRSLSANDPALASALDTYRSASASQQNKWAGAYADAAAKATVTNSTVHVKPGRYGPVPTLMSSELTLARSGGLDAALLAQNRFYGTNFTKPLLFMEDGGYFAAQAQSQHLLGNQWGVMNETGSYPGQPWLWLYQLWYHLPGFRNSANVDLIAIYLTGLATLVLLLVPFIPGLRDLPRWLRVYRLIWRPYYQEAEGPSAT